MLPPVPSIAYAMFWVGVTVTSATVIVALALLSLGGCL